MATFGNTGEGTEADSQDADQVTVAFAELTEAGDVTKISARCNRKVSAGNMQCAIYDVSGGVPNVRKGITQETEVGTGFAWYDFTFSPAVSLPAGTYALCIWEGDNGYNIYFSNGVSGDGMDDDSQTYNNWADPWGGTTNRDRARIYSIYATYTPSGGLSQTVTDTLTIGTTTPFTFTKNLSEALSLGDSHIKNFTKTQSDTLTVSDSFIRNFIKTVSDVLTITAEEVANLIGALSKTLTDTITIADTAIKNFLKSQTETLAISDTTPHSFTKSLSESISVVDSKIVNFVKTMTEQVGISESLSHTLPFDGIVVSLKLLKRKIAQTFTKQKIEQVFG